MGQIRPKSRLRAAHGGDRCYPRLHHPAGPQAACWGVSREPCQFAFTEVCKRDGEETFAGTRGNDEVAPITVVGRTAIEPPQALIANSRRVVERRVCPFLSTSRSAVAQLQMGKARNPSLTTGLTAIRGQSPHS